MSKHTLEIRLRRWDDEGESLTYNETEVIEEISREILEREEIRSVSIQNVDISVREDDVRYTNNE